MQLFGIHTRLIEPKDNLVNVLLDGLRRQKISMEDRDVLVIASKAVAVVQSRLVRLSSTKPSERAKKIAEKCNLEPSFVEVVLREAEHVYGGISGALLTLKNNVLIPNAGVDHKNAPRGYAVLWPEKPHESAEKIRNEISKRTGKRVGVLIIDSRVTPLRMGTTGVAIGMAGFDPIRDCTSDKDLYGNPLLITRHALADDLASAAHLIMGEANGLIPAVLVKNVPADFNEEVDLDSARISAKECLFMSCIVQNRVFPANVYE
jgi:coenzyme F420-0:L-glutamate ligase/coenzyme F420-1:gamma-L-glutamate ligase